MDEQKDRGDRGPTDPTRKLLKVFGVKVTDYEAKTDDLLARWSSANERDRATIRPRRSSSARIWPTGCARSHRTCSNGRNGCCRHCAEPVTQPLPGS